MKRAVYSKPSTFTHIGRHASELKFLLSRAKKKNEILNVGPGPLEPFYIAALSPNSRITVVDVNPKILEMINLIKGGTQVSLEDIANHCHNVQNDGSKRTNRDLLLKERIEKGLVELQLAGLNPETFVDSEMAHFHFTGSSSLHLIQSGISEWSHTRKYDVVFEGLVLLNLRKTLNDEEFRATVLRLMDLAKEDGIIGVGTTPAGISGSKEYLSTLMRVGMQLQEVVIDNILDAKGSLRGGYLATFSKEANSPLAVDLDRLQYLIGNESLLDQNGCRYRDVTGEGLIDALDIKNELLLAVAHKGEGNYRMLFVELEGMNIPSERYQFTVLSRL